ncbi:MAG: hypothetical protein ABJB17_10610 [Burkholderiales bacterium]
MNTAVTARKQSSVDPAAATTIALPALPSRLRGWLLLLALCALVGALVSFASNRTASYDDRLVDLRARQTLGPDVYRATGAMPALQAVLLDAAADSELAFKMGLTLDKYGDPARTVLEAFGAEAPLQALLRRFGEGIVPVIFYFMDHDVVTLRAGYELSRLGRTLQTQASAMFGDSKNKDKAKKDQEKTASSLPAAPRAPAPTPDPAPPEYSPLTRGRYAIDQIATSGHQFLAQFAVDSAGIAHWNQTDRVLKSVEDFLFGGIRNLETKYDVAAPIGLGDVASAGVDVLTVFGFLKAWKLLRASSASEKVAQQAALSEYRAVLGQRVIAGSGRVGRAALKVGAVAGTAYLVARHPGLLTSLFVEAGGWLGLPAWAASATGWWLIAFVLSALLMPLLAVLAVLAPLLTRLVATARWLIGLDRWHDARATPAPATALQAARTNPEVSAPRIPVLTTQGIDRDL